MQRLEAVAVRVQLDRLLSDYTARPSDKSIVTVSELPPAGLRVDIALAGVRPFSPESLAKRLDSALADLVLVARRPGSWGIECDTTVAGAVPSATALVTDSEATSPPAAATAALRGPRMRCEWTIGGQGGPDQKEEQQQRHAQALHQIGPKTKETRPLARQLQVTPAGLARLRGVLSAAGFDSVARDELVEFIQYLQEWQGPLTALSTSLVVRIQRKAMALEVIQSGCDAFTDSCLRRVRTNLRRCRTVCDCAVLFDPANCQLRWSIRLHVPEKP